MIGRLHRHLRRRAEFQTKAASAIFHDVLVYSHFGSVLHRPPRFLRVAVFPEKPFLRSSVSAELFLSFAPVSAGAGRVAFNPAVSECDAILSQGARRALSASGECKRLRLDPSMPEYKFQQVRRCLRCCLSDLLPAMLEVVPPLSAKTTFRSFCRQDILPFRSSAIEYASHCHRVLRTSPHRQIRRWLRWSSVRFPGAYKWFRRFPEICPDDR